jgi:galactose oxidase
MVRQSYLRANSSASIILAVLTLSSPAFAAPGSLYRYVVSSNKPLVETLAIPANAATQGMWSLTQPWPLVGLHVVVMPDGRVLTFGSPDGIGVQDGRTLDLWNPSLGFSPSSHLQIANGQMVDSFCASAAILPIGGSVLVSGGGGDQDGYTSFASTLVNPATSTAINNGKPLHEQHWYGTMITLPDGRTLMGGGGAPYAIGAAYLDPAGTLPNISVTPEIFTPGKGWAQMWGKRHHRHAPRFQDYGRQHHSAQCRPNIDRRDVRRRQDHPDGRQWLHRWLSESI